jgi:iron complex transport system permease protein
MARKQKNFITIIILLITLAFSAFLSIMLGTVALKPADVLYAIFHGSSNDLTSLLVHNVRMPRTAGAVLTGMGLAVAGTILQSVMNNSLASPNTIGVNSGAGFAVMVGMLIFNGSNAYSPIFAFAGALITTLIIYALASIGDSSRTTIILAGITVSSFLSAGINTIKLLDTDITINITTFMIGTLSGITYKAIAMPAIGIIGGVLVSFLFAKHMNVLSLGDDIARSLGLNVPLTRFVLLTIASLLAGCVVSYAGLLSFVGLIVPHIARRLYGNDARLLLPCSAILGAIFVTLCDLIGRMIAAPYELPAGIIMSFIGGPFFLYLLLKKKGGRRVNA